MCVKYERICRSTDSYTSIYSTKTPRGKSPALLTSLLCLNENQPWLWMQNWVLKHELPPCVRGENFKRMGGGLTFSSSFIPSSLYATLCSATPDFGLRRTDDSIKIRKMGKGTLKQYKSENSYFSPTLPPSFLPLHPSTNLYLASLLQLFCILAKCQVSLSSLHFNLNS